MPVAEVFQFTRTLLPFTSEIKKINPNKTSFQDWKLQIWGILFDPRDLSTNYCDEYHSDVIMTTISILIAINTQYFPYPHRYREARWDDPNAANVGIVHFLKPRPNTSNLPKATFFDG